MPPFSFARGYRRLTLLAVGLLIGGALAAALLGFKLAGDWRDSRSQGLLAWSRGDAAGRQELVTTQQEPCPGAPFILPAAGYVGLFYGDPRGPYSAARPHQGIDIITADGPGQTPVYAAYDGYLTRERDWRSTVILRVPDDPLQPGRQIWLYYTHMADESGRVDYIAAAFPAGARERFVPQGTLLGYAGNYNGDSRRGVWVHLHFSIVLDDGRGGYRNELQFDNTLDPSPYLGMPLHYQCAPPLATGCSPNPVCSQGAN